MLQIETLEETLQNRVHITQIIVTLHLMNTHHG